VQNTYRPEIDGLRAVAVLAVLTFHAFPQVMPGGFVGVDVFFVISGYLITRDIVARRAAGTFSLADFYSRRIRRIFPALITILVAVLAFGWLVNYPDEFERLLAHAMAGVAFVQNFRLLYEAGYFDVSSASKPLLHLWSLAIEEQFYLLWPLALMLGRRDLRWAATIAVASFAANLWYVGIDPTAAYYLPFTRFWQLMAGALLAIVPVESGSPSRANALATLGAAFCAASFSMLDAGARYPGWPALLPTCGAVLLIAAGPAAWTSRLLALRLPVGVGLVSYPLYLWHWPVLAYLRTLEPNPPPLHIALSMVLAMVLATLTYQLIERPLRSPIRIRSKVRGLAAVMAAVGALCAAVFPVAASVPRWSEMTRSQAMLEDLRNVEPQDYAPCDPALRGAAPELTACLQSGPPQVALIGDSHAVHLFSALADVDKSRGWLLAARSSCPPLKGVHVDSPFGDCGATMDKVLERVASDARIQTVVLAFFGSYDSATDFAFDHVQARNGPSVIRVTRPGTADKPTAIAAGLHDTVELLSSAGKRVVLVIDVPELSFSPRGCVARPLARSKIENCAMAVAAVLERQASLRRTVAELQRGFPALRVFDPMSVLCDDRRCQVDRGGMLAYSDSHHLSLRGSHLVSGPLLALLKSP
jgi:peptidoglycan/LPS O-acetylase OafA/YrhL